MSTGQYDEKLGCSYCLKFIVIRYSISDRDTSTRSCHTFYFHNTGLEVGGPSFFPRYFSHLFTDIYCSVRQLQWRTHLDIDLPYYHCSQNSEPSTSESRQLRDRLQISLQTYEFKCFSLIISGERWNLDTNPYLALNVVIWKLSKIRDFSKLIHTRKVTSTHTNHSCSYQFSFISIISFWIPPSDGRLLWNCLRQNVSKSITIFFSFWNLNWSYKVLKVKNWCSQFFQKNYHFGEKPQIPPK